MTTQNEAYLLVVYFSVTNVSRPKTAVAPVTPPAENPGGCITRDYLVTFLKYKKRKLSLTSLLLGDSNQNKLIISGVTTALIMTIIVVMISVLFWKWTKK